MDSPAPAEGAAPQESSPATAAPPSFQVDVEAFSAAAPEGYDVNSATDILTRHKGDVFSLVKQTAELEKSFSSRMSVPDPSNPEKMADVFNKMGRPADAAGYAWDDGIKFTDDAAKDHLSAFMHETGLSNIQANAILKKQLEINTQADAQFHQDLTDGKALTDKQIQEWSGGLKGSKAFNDYENVFDSVLKSQGVDFNAPENQEFFASESGRKIIKLAYDYGTAAQPGQIPGISEQTNTVGSLDQRMSELYKEISANPHQWNANPSKQAELNSLKQQKRQMTR
jgi:hypothetical protein